MKVFSSTDSSSFSPYMGEEKKEGYKGKPVKMEATHSGYINDNGKFYVPALMRDGISSFKIKGVDGKKKSTKILKHHDNYSDPVGIVKEVRFIPQIPPILADNADVLALFDSSSPPARYAEAFRNLWKLGILSSPNWSGLGYLEISADILDPKTREQLEQELIDDISTSFHSSRGVVCSICGSDQYGMADGCGHNWGQMYALEGSKDKTEYPCLPIPLKHEYDEVSFVNTGADKYASLSVLDSKNGNLIISIPSQFGEAISVEDRVKRLSCFKEATKNMDKLEEIIKILKAKYADLTEEKLSEIANKIVCTLKDEQLPNQEEAEIDFETAVTFACDSLLTEIEEITDEILSGIDKLYEDEFSLMETEGLLTKEQADDAKLSTKSRETLPESSFCGPNKSFPVPDCSHATAAKRLIGKYKGPGDKAKILACVARKEKALGCPVKDAVSPKEEVPETEVKDSALNTFDINSKSDEELKLHYEDVEKVLISRELKVERICADCLEHAEKQKELEEELAKIKNQVEKQKDHLSILREEYALLNSDYVIQAKKNLELSKALNDFAVDSYSIVSVLTKKHGSVDEAKKEFTSKSFEDLKVLFSDSKFNDSLFVEGDGMTRIPSGETVLDPTLNQEGLSEILLTSLSAPAREAVKNIKECYSNRDLVGANRIYVRMKSLELFPRDLKLDDIVNQAEKA